PAGSATNLLCKQINRLVCNNVDEGKFITFFYCSFDTRTLKMSYTNAGHDAPILVRRSGEILRLFVGGPVLGLNPDFNYEVDEVELEPGDRLVLYTDGLTEARDLADEEFGEERLSAILHYSRELGSHDIQRRIVKAVDFFSRGETGDDATLIVLALDA
ncbi:MAG: serine/threonine-protein phosphatase, partial [Blastocatellia bacterium]|nr:serine/threonine-protein phosphatase [Blastocatellia bacterium]